MAKLRGGLVGCGHISSRHLRAWAQVEDAEIVAVCDLDEHKAREAAERFNIASVYTEVERMLAGQRLDFVDIATRPAGHLPLVRLASGRGLHVLCQKPLADTLEQCREMTDQCRQAGVTFMVHENGRFQPWFRQFKDLIDRGELGRVFSARLVNRARLTLPRPEFEAQPYFLGMPRLLVFELGVHFLDAMRLMLGEPQSVYARMKRIGPGLAGEDNAVLMIAFGDVNVVVDMSWCSMPIPGGGRRVSWCQFQLEGTEGTAALGTDGVLTLYRPDRPDQPEHIWRFPEDSINQSFVATQRHFVECVRGGREPETSGEQTMRTMRLVFGAYESAETGKVVALPAD